MNSRRVTVKKIISSRYPVDVARPSNWDERTTGYDIIESTEGEYLKLASTGQQSVPQPGWVILLSPKHTQSNDGLHSWTLFGMPGSTTSPL